jgi:hypothetical protein
MVATGECSVDESGCLLSPHHPQQYGSDQDCVVAVFNRANLHIKVITFDTEELYDTLTVNDVKYGGSQGPEGVAPTGNIQWHSDYSIAGTGWKLCLE